MTDSEFVEFFFSINCPDHFVSLKIMNSFLKALPKQHNLDIVKKIILNPNFKSYYINIDTYGLRNLLSHFIDIETVPSAQDELVDFISSFEGKDKMNVIRLLYKHIKKPELQRQYTVYMNTQ